MTTQLTLPPVETSGLFCPGVKRDVPFEVYRSWPCVNAGSLKWGRVSPLHMHSYLTGRIADHDTDARKLGRAIHCAILEPDEFEQRFLKAGPCEALLKGGARKGEPCGLNGKELIEGRWYCGTHGTGYHDHDVPGVEVLSPTDWQAAVEARDALKGHWIQHQFRRKGWSEVSITWPFTHKGCSLFCKGRLDRYCPNGTPTIIDLKKMQVGAGDREACRKVILNYGYHRQAAMYCKGIEYLTGKLPEFIWVFIEDGPPYDVQMIPAEQIDIEIGWREASTVLAAYAEACQRNEFDGYIRRIDGEPIISTGGLPAWYVKQAEEMREGIE